MIKRFTHFWRETLEQFREVNTFIHKIDPFMSVISWIRPIWSAALMLGSFGGAGVLVHHLAKGYGKGSEIPEWIIYALAAGVVVWGLTLVFGRSYGQWRKEVFDDRFQAACETRFVEKLSKLDIGRLMDPEFIRLCSQVGIHGERWENAQEVIKNLWEFQRNTIGTFAAGIASFAIFSVLDPFLIVIACIPAIFEAVNNAVIEKRRRALWRQQYALVRQKETYIATLNEPQNFLQAKLFQGVSFLRERYAYFRDILLAGNRNFEQKAELLRGGAQAFGVVLGGFGIIYLGYRVQSGALPLDQLFLLAGSLAVAVRSIANLLDVRNRLDRCLYEYGLLRELMNMPPLIDESKARDVTFISTPRIEFSHVSFSYPRFDDKTVLQDCSLVIESGERVIIVGRNGAGKTTLMHLVSKIYLPSQGAIRIGDVDTKDMTQASLIQQAVYMTQNSAIPQLRINEAVAFSLPEQINNASFKRAADLAGTPEFVDQLSDGFATQIGSDREFGQTLSGGQMQRLRLMSAFYRLLEPEVRIGLFDEPNSQVDVETRERFHQGLKTFPDKTIIVIAHDPLYLHHFDRVIVMKEGIIAQDIRGQEEILKLRESIMIDLSTDLID